MPPDFPGKYKHSWVEETFIRDEGGALANKSRNFLGISLGKRRVIILGALMAIGLLLLLSRTAYLQLWRGGDFFALAEGNRVRLRPLPAERGIITDRAGTPLVQNVPKFSLAIVPQELPRNEEERRAVIQSLAEKVAGNPEELNRIINEYRAFAFDSITIKDNLTYEQALKVVVTSESPAVRVERGSRRAYPLTAAPSTKPMLSLAHLLGYEGKLSPKELPELLRVGYLPPDTIGRTGIEAQYEEALRGVYGKRFVEVDAIGHELKTIAEAPPQNGKHITLTLDLKAQEVLEDALQRVLRVANKTRGSAIALDPRNGEIIALVSLPAFDNNAFARGINTEEFRALSTDEKQPLFNRAIAGAYPSGSTIKPFIAAAALAEGIINAQTSIVSTGGIRVSQWFFPDWKTGGHGATNVVKAIAESVNTFFYIIGGGYEGKVGLGVNKITEYLRAFGFSQTLGIDLPGEASGFIPSPEWKKTTKGETWYIGDTYNISIGQGDVLITPLQMAAATAAIANGGKLLEPHMVAKVGDLRVVPKVISEVPVGAANLQLVQTGMRATVTQGSARQLSLLHVAVAGKTGTAQWSSIKAPHAWFTGYAPADNPEIVVSIMIEEGEEGSRTAVPVAFEFFNWWARARK